MSAPPHNAPRLDDWLQTLCLGISGAELALASLRLGPAGEPRRPAIWPADARPSDRLLEVASSAATRRVPTVVPVPGSTDGAFDVGCPLMRGDQVHGVVAVTVRGGPGVQQGAVQALRRGSDWLALMLRAGLHESSGSASQASIEDHLLDAIRSALTQGNAIDGALAAVSVLANHLDCERVSWGRIRHAQGKVIAISDTARVDRRRPLVRAISGAMEECADAGAAVVHPPREDGSVASVHAHRVLAEAGQCPIVVSVPTETNDAVLVAECSAGADVTETVDALTRAVQILGPLLATRAAAERGPLSFARWRIAGRLDTALFRRLFKAAALAAVVAGVVWAARATGPYAVRAEAVVEGRIQNAITAPFDGYLAAVNAVPGDSVGTNQILAVLEARTLALEKDQLDSEREALEKGHRRALAALDKSEARVIRARIDQVEAQLELIESRIARTRLRAPYDGIVLSGDLSRSLGRPVEQGEVLMEVAPANDYRVVVEVEGSDVAYVMPGQRGSVRLASLPDDQFPVQVERLSSVAESGARTGTFRIEARLLGGHDRVRPGMRGIARLEAGERPLLEAWFHQAMTPVRLWWWTWAP